MNQLKGILLLCCIVSLVACSGDGKKVVIMSSGKMTLDHNSNTITLETGTQHNEEQMTVGGKGVITVKGPNGDQTFELPENGFYVLNLKQNDTLVGGIVNYGSSTKRDRIDDRELTHIIDSTRRLILGMGASDSTKTYYILPFTIKKITDNLQSTTVVGPYQGIPYKVEGKGDQKPEVYKLYTNKQQRESLLELFRRMK